MPFKRSLYLLQPFCQREVHFQIDCYIIGIDNNFVRLCRDINQAFVDIDTQIALSRSFNHRDCSFFGKFDENESFVPAGNFEPRQEG